LQVVVSVVLKKKEGRPAHLGNIWMSIYLFIFLTNFGPLWLIDTLVLRILLLFRLIVTNQLARSVSFKERLICRNVRVIDSWLLLSLPAGGGGVASSIAGGQHPVLRRPSWCHGEAGIRLQSPSTTPPTSLGIVDHMGLARGGWRSAIVLRPPCLCSATCQQLQNLQWCA